MLRLNIRLQYANQRDSCYENYFYAVEDLNAALEHYTKLQKSWPVTRIMLEDKDETADWIIVRQDNNESENALG